MDYMKRLFWSLLALTSLGFHEANAKARLVEKVKAEEGKLVIPYEKYLLDNGLTLIIHEDHSDPIVHVDVTYHVGSAREEIGKSGFAHFFEHMMFQGSDNVDDEQHFKIITEAGGTLNGTTNRDRTNYFETVPSNQLEKMLWLEADRMGFFLDAVTQQKFEVQRATVKNERGQRYDNRPYGLIYEVTSKNLYPYGHPYSWMTIGYVEDLDRVTVDDLKNFFLRWYGPNNAVLTVGGDVNPAEVVKMVEKYFGPIPRGPEVEPVKLDPVHIEKDRYVSMVDNYAQLPMLRITYPSVPSFHPDEAPLDCLAEILGQGKNSIIYQNFIKGQLAVNAVAMNPTSELAGEFTFVFVPYPGKALSDIEAEFRKALRQFEETGVRDEDIEKFRQSMESNMIYGLESVSGKVSQLAAYHTFTGDANYFTRDLERYRNVTKEDVMRVYNKYLKDKAAVIVSLTPKGQEDNVAGEPNYTINEEGYEAPDYGYDGLEYVKAKDTFDRSQIPPNGENPVVEVPEFWRKDLAGPIRVIGTHSDEIPVVNISLGFKGGRMMEFGKMDKTGLASLFAAMMMEDTENYTAEELSLELEKLGSSISVSATTDDIRVRIKTLTKNLQPTLKLAEEVLLRPRFTAEAFDREKKRTLESIRNNNTRPEVVANQVFDKVMYGPDHLFAATAEGTEETVGNIELKDIEAFYKNYISRNGLDIVVVGDVGEEVTESLGFLTQLSNQPIPMPKLAPAPPIEKTRIYFVDIPGAAQTEFRIGKVTDLRYDALGDYYKANVMNYPLGGAFNSRLNLNLREENGWTYGARGYFSGDKYTGTYTFMSGIKADATDSALVEILRILKEYRETGMDAEELRFTQNSMGQSEARKYELGYQKAAFLSRILDYDLDPDYTRQQTEILNQLTAKEMQDLARRYLPHPDKMHIVLVGDKESLWDSLKGFGYELVEIDRNGKPL